MTGKWIRRRRDEAPPSHVRASLSLEDGHVIDYRDPRLFGRLVRGPAQELKTRSPFAKLGPDPLAGIDVDRFFETLSRTRRSLKEALMDQRTLAGLGNIQVSEALHRARLHPERLGVSLSREEAERLSRAIADSLRATLQGEDGDEPITYVEEGGENIFLVYGREGEPCGECGGSIERIVQGGRSTYFCPRCQPSVRRKYSGARSGSGRARLAAVRPLRSVPVAGAKPRSPAESSGRAGKRAR
jgi:formamidopyrimidine-DNA glycosylase